MEQILYRAKRLDNGELYEGASLITGEGRAFLADRGDKAMFISCDTIALKLIELDPTTICRGLGRTDANGKQIFEGDILYGGESYHRSWGNAVVRFGAYEANSEDCGIGFYYYLPKSKEVSGIAEEALYKFTIVGNEREDTVYISD